MQDIKTAKMSALAKLVEALKEIEKEGWEGMKTGKTMVVQVEKEDDQPPDKMEAEEEEETTPTEELSDEEKEDIKSKIFKKLKK